MFSYVWSTGRTFVASSPHKFSKSYRILRWTRSLSSHLRIHVQCRLKTSFVRWIITVLINLLVLSKQYIQSLILTINYRKPWWFCFELEYSTTDSRRLRTRYGTVSLTFFFITEHLSDHIDSLDEEFQKSYPFLNLWYHYTSSFKKEDIIYYLKT